MYDFDLFFKNVDGNALRSKWDTLLRRPLQDWKENIDVTKVATKDENIWKFFALFDKFKPNRSHFYNIIKSLLIFSEVKDCVHDHHFALNFLLFFLELAH